MVHQLKTTDLCIRSTFCREMLTRMNENENFIRNFWTSDETHFHLKGFV